ncbi:MAG: DNA mismatch repair protein MutS, partial [Alphaproteobacteria bacterium]
GFRVAVTEQLEAPSEAKKRGYKAIVKRDVTRLVTPGTLTEDSLLDARAHNYLAAISDVRGEMAISWVDVSTGDFHVTPISRVTVGPTLARLAPREVLATESIAETLRETVEESGAALTPLSAASFDSTAAEGRLTDLFRIKSLDAFGNFERAEIAAMGAIVDYLDITQRGKLPLLRPPSKESQGGTVQIDAATRRNLELVRNLSGERQGSLLATIDRTVTGGGARLLSVRLTSPSTDLTTINARHDAVQHFVENRALAEDTRETLRQAPDMERALSRLALDRAGPRDIAALRSGLAQAGALSASLDGALPDMLQRAACDMTGHEELVELLNNALIAEPPLLARDGGFVAQGYNADLDEARKLRDEGRSVIAAMQAEYATLTGIASIKIKHNNVLGYFVETPASHADKMLSEPLSETFIHRQTTANQVRFTTVPLSEMETKILNAGGRALEIEKAIFTDLRTAIMDQAAQIAQAAKALAETDLAAALADIAVGENWVRPQMDASRAFTIEGGRHPVVEQALRRSGESFVANDCDLTAGEDNSRPVWLLTGPNMAGKSTFLRQNALITLLAQMGAYVPAAKAHIGVIDQLFSRVGAADDLARGRSTFMVEMVETAAILNQAGDRALVILDEIGRGTATYDGLSIAWATLEHLHDVNHCRTLFATHYHELSALTAKLSGMKNATVAVREWEGDVVFLHEVREGAADRSYGVQVAKLAGLPSAVIERARTVLDALEQGDRDGGGKAETLIDDLPLFSATPLPPPAKNSEVEDRLRDVHPDELTAREALALVYSLREMLGE